MLYILHYTKESGAIGYGNEYIVLMTTEPKKHDLEKECQKGFELSRIIKTAVLSGDTDVLPLNHWLGPLIE